MFIHTTSPTEKVMPKHKITFESQYTIIVTVNEFPWLHHTYSIYIFLTKNMLIFYDLFHTILLNRLKKNEMSITISLSYTFYTTFSTTVTLNTNTLMSVFSKHFYLPLLTATTYGLATQVYTDE